MANYIYRVVSVFEKWASGYDLGEEEVYEASRLLGTPTRKLEAFLERFRSVIGGLVEERCSDAGGGRVCIYTWSRRAYKRYFPAALDAAGTVLYYPEPGRVELVSYPLHRAYDLGVHGVELPGEDPAYVSPRLDGWQVNLYWDPILNRWVFSTRYVLHNMRFTGRRLHVEDYGVTVNPLVETAERVASRQGLLASLGDQWRGWTLTLVLAGEEPATAKRGLPEPDEADEYTLVLLAARKPTGELVDPLEAPSLGLPVETLAARIARGLSRGEALEKAQESLEYPSLFLWYPARGDPEHPEYYEAKSAYYQEYIGATRRMDAKSLVVLLTAGDKRVEEALREALGETIVAEVLGALKSLEETLARAVEEGRVRETVEALGLPAKQARSIERALEEGKTQRALRIAAATIVQGLAAGEAAYVLQAAVEKLRQALQGRG